ncbi:VOC family protein [Bacillus carboniphilus]|uniref:VOC family protein n=1 Tax=Bacillus carboniphilus TaxID=86663 RepID=A0ABN0WAH7_9BACI
MFKLTNPYLTFNGNAKEALEFYKQVLKGEITNLSTFGEADFPTPPEADHRIIHARFEMGEQFFMVSDTFPNQTVEVGSNISLVLDFDSDAEIKEIYDHMVENGKILMELQDTFWGATYAKVQDPFGIIWELNYTKQQ